MKKLLIPITGFLILMLIGCEGDIRQRNVYGSGPIVEKTVDMALFKGLILEGAADVYISIGDTQKVVLKAQQEILDVMTAEVNKQVLIVGFRESVNVHTDEDVIVEITVLEFNSLQVDGAGEFELSGEKQDYLDIEVNGTANIEAYDMQVDNCDITVNGVCNSWVWVLNSLDVVVNGVGHIYFRGDPTVTSSINGTGSVIDDN